MKIDYSEVIKLRLSGLEDLDPIDVFLDDTGLSQGSVTIKCYGQAWTAYWGAMGDRSVAQFLNECDDDYIAKNLSSVDRQVVDVDKIISDKVTKITAAFSAGEINSTQKSIQIATIEEADPDQIKEDYRLLSDVCGESFWDELPMKENHEHTYLKKIIAAVKQGIVESELLEEEDATPIHTMRI